MQEAPLQPGRVPESLQGQKDALAEFEKHAQAYAEALAAGGVDLSEPREPTLKEKYGILNRQMARGRGLRARSMSGRAGAVPSSKQKHKKARKAAKLARKRNRA